MKNKTAIITGVSGQDGHYLSKLLLSKGYRVIGLVRRSSQPRDNLIPLVKLGLEAVEGDVTDYSSIERIVSKYKPDHIYNLAAMSHVGSSFEQPLYTWDVVAKGTLNVLEVVRNTSPSTRIYQASSSEMFGKSFSTLADRVPDGWEPTCEEYKTKFQDEKTPFAPQSPYGIAKLAAHEAVRLYRQSYGIFACAGILFNHDSECRGEMFFTRKVTRYIGNFLTWKNNIIETETGGVDFVYNLPADRILTVRLNRNKMPYGHNDAWWFGPKFPKLKLGNLYPSRDLSHSEDMVTAMHLMLCADEPKDYVVGSGESHTMEEFVKEAFDYVGLNYSDHVTIDQDLIRPSEVDYLRADPSLIRKELGWEPKIDFRGLVHRMVDHDKKRAKVESKI